MKSLIVLYTSFCFPILAIGQVNLVPNPSFEDTLHCSSDVNVIKTKYWYRPTACGTPDFYYPNQMNVQCGAHYPQVWGGGDYTNLRGFQMPRSGMGYVGFGVSLGSELLAVRLTDSLMPSKHYEISFYVSLAEVSISGLDQVNLSFMSDSLTDFNISTCWSYLGGLTTDAGNQGGNILIDTSNWVLVVDTFLADGGERYMIVGNIDTASTQYYFMDSTMQIGAYYYFDDFDVHCIDCTSDTSEPPVYREITITPTLTQGELVLRGNFPSGTKFEVYDVLGQLVFYDELQSGNQTQIVFLPLGAGVYTCRVMAEGSLLKAEKVVVVK